MNINALVIDDSGIMRKLVMKTLGETHLATFTFQEAKDGQEALAIFKAGKFDMLFCDWNMPNMNGMDLIKIIRNELKSRVPVVMITTEGTMDKLDEALNTGHVDGYIVKPFTPEGVGRKIAPILQKMTDAKKNSSGVFAKLAAKLQ
ncbi:MAG TPA: response regulator [Verrucomicrobiae bacterium]|nr:response regulator [Verrucomicrobiae bacterium]